MKITAKTHGSAADMLNAFQNQVDELKNSGVDADASTDVQASAFETHYILEDSYEAPQAGSDEIEFDSYDELIDYLDDNPDVLDRINDGYALVKEKTVEGCSEIDSCELVNACNARDAQKEEPVESSFDLSDPDFDDAWDTLRDNGVSEETLQVVTDINGNSVDTLNDVARAVFGVDLEDLGYHTDEEDED